MPEELWPEVLRKIDGPLVAGALADEIDDGDDAEDEYDFGASHADEDCQTPCAGTGQFHRRGQEGVTITEKVPESAHPPIRTFSPPAKTDEDDGF